MKSKTGGRNRPPLFSYNNFRNRGKPRVVRRTSDLCGFRVITNTNTGDWSHSNSTGSAVNQGVMESTIQPSCLNCDFRPDRLFCDMPLEALQAFDKIKTISTDPKGAVLFGEGRPSKGIFVLCDGRAKLSICSESGKRLMLRIAGPGEVLGLGATMAGTPYEVTAELLDASQVVFIKRKDLMRFLRDNRDACMMVVNLLSQDLHGAYERVRSIGLTRSRRPRATRMRM